MNTSISSRVLPSCVRTLSRSSRIVEAGRGTADSGIQSTRCAGVGMEVRALVNSGDAREKIINFRFRGRRNRRTWLALRAGRDDAALLKHVLADREPCPGLLL